MHGNRFRLKLLSAISIPCKAWSINNFAAKSSTHLHEKFVSYVTPEVKFMYKLSYSICYVHKHRFGGLSVVKVVVHTLQYIYHPLICSSMIFLFFQ